MMTADEAYRRASDTVCELLDDLPDRQARIQFLHRLSRDMEGAVRVLQVEIPA